MKTIITVILLFLSITMFTQTITGKILDKEDNPIIYATIQITEDFGVLSNEEGQFLIETINFKPTDIVTISYLGYKNLQFSLKDFESKDYYLEEDINLLDEITLFNNKKLTVQEILDKVKENAPKNYAVTNIKQQIFDRTSYTNIYRNFDFNFKKSNLIKKKKLKELNKSIDDLVKQSINKPSTNYEAILSELYISQENSKINVIKATKLINKNKDNSEDKMQKLLMTNVAKYLEKDATYKVKSGLFKVEDSLSVTTHFEDDNIYTSKILRNDYLETIDKYSINEDSKLNFIYKNKKYNYDLEGISYLGGNMVYIIKFYPKSKSAKYKGKIYINADDFAVIKTKFQLAKGKTGRKLNLKFVLGMKMFEYKIASELLFQKNSNGKYQIRLIKEEIGSSIYAKRPMKFIKNRKNSSEKKQILKLDFLMEFNQIQKQELFFINTKELSTQKFTNIKEKEKYTKENIPKYTPEIWKSYNVLNPIEAIKNYKTND